MPSTGGTPRIGHLADQLTDQEIAWAIATLGDLALGIPLRDWSDDQTWVLDKVAGIRHADISDED